jgi:hypothetical protein
MARERAALIDAVDRLARDRLVCDVLDLARMRAALAAWPSTPPDDAPVRLRGQLAFALIAGAFVVWAQRPPARPR